MSDANGWEMVGPDVCGDRVRRMRVTGGWLYQVESFEHHDPMIVGEPGKYVCGWHPPVFVAFVPEAKEAPRAAPTARPERTGYSDENGYHPPPGAPAFKIHVAMCRQCVEALGHDEVARYGLEKVEAWRRSFHDARETIGSGRYDGRGGS